MVKILLSAILFVFVQNGIWGQAAKKKMSEEGQKLYALIMEYRKSKGLNIIPLSSSLTYVAQIHCKDLSDNQPDLKSKCNAHSWSTKGNWTSCCYTPDHKESKCMWNKPKELTSYTGDGYEIVVSASYTVTADDAIEAWKNSHSHNELIINRGIWKDSEWKAIGIGLYKGYAAVWFGEEVDVDGG